MCFVKHSELRSQFHVYKGRVVFQGNQVKDQDGFSAIYGDQGTSASHLSATKFLDAIARLPGCNGADSDAVGAYTQAFHQGDLTHVSIPKDRRPKSWKRFRNPVCRLIRNLYGHPQAGLYWEKHCKQALLRCGFEPVKDWECLYLHRRKQLFVSVYVDDFKMAGKAASLSPMWEELGKHLSL